MAIDCEWRMTELQVLLAMETLSVGLVSGSPVVFSLEGEREQYVRCKLDSIEVSLYADGFDLQGEGLDVRYEPDDIRSPAGAVALLSGELRAALAR